MGGLKSGKNWGDPVPHEEAVGSDMKACAAKLTGCEHQEIQEVVQLMSPKEAPVPAAFDKRAAEEEEAEAKVRKLKKEISDVSVDASGFPKCFGTPDSILTKDAPSEGSPLASPSFLRRRPGQLVAKPSSSEQQIALRTELGLGTKKKPAGKKVKKKTKKKKKEEASPLTKGAHSKTSSLSKGKAKKKQTSKGAAQASSLTKGKKQPGRSLPKGSAAVRKPWVKLQVTSPKKPPWRQYICGSTSVGGKAYLIVQTTKVGHPLYKEILEEVKRKLEKNHLTKEEAVELRDYLYKTW